MDIETDPDFLDLPSEMGRDPSTGETLHKGDTIASTGAPHDPHTNTFEPPRMRIGGEAFGDPD